MTTVSRVDEPNLFDEPSVAHALRLTLIAILASALAISAVTLLLGWRLTPQLALLAGGSSVVALALSRSAWIRPAFMLPLLSITYAVLHLAARSEGIQNIGLAILPVLIMVGSLLLDSLMLIFFTAGTILAVSAMLAIRYFVLRVERYSTNDMGDLFVFTLTCGTAALVGRLLAVRIQEGFRLVRRRESSITEQKVIEERLRASEARLKDTQRLAKVGSWERHIDADRIYWSEEASKIFGGADSAPSSFIDFLKCVHAKDREKILEAGRKVRLTGAPVDVEYRITRRDGEVRFVRSIVEAIRNEQGVTVRQAGATQDITEQVKSRELLRESEERLKKAERLARVGHWHRDVKSNQVIWSEECFRIFGQPQDYIPNYEKFLQAVVPQDRELVERAERHHLEEKRGISIEYRIVRPDGEVRKVASVSEVLLDEEGSPVRMFGAVQDITDARRAQEESVARQKLESIGALASGIAHDFNNLLGGVVAYTELAQAECASGSSPEAELKAIRDMAMRGSEIVRQLMIYAGKESAVVEPLDVSRTVQQMLELLKVSISKHAVLEADLGRDLPAVRADAAQLGQIVMNLVMNASDAIGDRDGVIHVTTRCVKVGRVSGAGSDRLAVGDYVQLEVSDTGRGIPVETQDQVFDPLFTTKSAGHGLGLAIVQGIVRGLGGAIHLTSAPGAGTTVQILLPPCAETNVEVTQNRTARTEEAAPPPQSAIVLLVEDEDLLRQAVAKMLRKAGFVVFEAVDGSSAIDVLHADGNKIDLMLLDMTIPGATSAEVVREAVKVRTDIKVILTSAYSQEMIGGATSLPQICSFIRKPFQIRDLVKALENALNA
jgi:two-component system cell cycle sensor histidine kinase/response regulator CckA